MKEIENFKQQLRESTGIRLAVLFGSLFLFLIFISIFSTYLSTFPQIGESTALLISTSLQSLLVFILPAIITAYYSSSKPFYWLDLKTGINWKNIVGVIIVYIIAIPFMNFLILWNENITLPGSLSKIEELLRSWEEIGEQTTSILLNEHGAGAVIIRIIVIGILTGFAEEIFFRGSLQKVLEGESTRRKTILAIWITAFIFSAFHFQFYGFFPRLLMGAFFGYLIFWTGSLWVPVFAHALNNSMVVLTFALNPETPGNSFLETVGTGENGFPITAFASFILTIVFLYFCSSYFFFTKKQKSILWQKKRPLQNSEKL